MLRLPSADAWRNIAKDNAHARWDAAPGERHWPCSARKRLHDPLFLTGLRPSFTIAPSDGVFCIGSCFARNIEDALVRSGFAVLSRPHHASIAGVMNKYNTWSMLNEVRWALEPEAHPFPEDSLIEEAGGVTDPHLSGVGPGARDDVIARRREMNVHFAALRRARLLIVTLGLVEAWYDTRTGLYLTDAPPFAVCRRDTARYELRVISYQENRAALEALHDLIRRHADPALRMIVTVSPVPFLATFTDQDVVVANTYSKSTLRAVATDFVLGREGVDYFPSYEGVMNSSRSVTWETDQIHVTELAVGANILHFLSHYLEGEQGERAQAALTQLLGSVEQATRPAPAGATAPPMLDGDIDHATLFPAGVPSVSASSAVVGLGPERLAVGQEHAWVAAAPVGYPQILDFAFPEPLAAGAVWLQSHQRWTGNAPTLISVAASADGADWQPVMTSGAITWSHPREWKRFALPDPAGRRHYRIVIRAGDRMTLSLLRVWFEPAAGPPPA